MKIYKNLPIAVSVLHHIRQRLQVSLFREYLKKYGRFPIRQSKHEYLASVVKIYIKKNDCKSALRVIKAFHRETVLPVIMLLDDQAAITVMTALEQDKK